METSQLIFTANQWTVFNMITASVMKELTKFSNMSCNILPHHIAIIRKIANINFFNKTEHIKKYIKY